MNPLPVTCSDYVDTVNIVVLICTMYVNYGIVNLWACRPTPRCEACTVPDDHGK